MTQTHNCGVAGCKAPLGLDQGEFCAAHEAKVPAKWRQAMDEAWDAFVKLPRQTPFHDRLNALRKYGRACCFAAAFAKRKS
jgi:hypothetical protein